MPRLGRLAGLLAAPAILIAATAIHAAPPNQLTPEQIAEGWISLFDGETLFGWTPTSNANWEADGHHITVHEGDEGFLATTAEFADYELHIAFKSSDNTNSGIFLRTPLEPTDPSKDCYELNIAPAENPYPTGSLVGRYKLDPSDKEVKKTLRKFEQIEDEQAGWRTFDVVVKGGNVSVSMYGQHLYDYVDPTHLRRGRIALQFRGGGIAFGDIRLKPLGLKPMLNGKDLAGWNTDNAEASKFEITPDGELHVTNGRGILATDDNYGDFVMQLDAYVDGDGLNSGVFFRSIPREYANGYESQIHNGYKDNDPTKPTDFGTGAIYRRVPARRVVSKDHEWFTMTLVPTGPHVSVWVNGYQVTDWTDDRPEHENPRNGLRLKPGTIAIQGHDPTTNLRFRNLKIAELPEKTNHDDTTNTTEEKK